MVQAGTSPKGAGMADPTYLVDAFVTVTLLIIGMLFIIDSLPENPPKVRQRRR